MSEHYKCFTHRGCEYFPCHRGVAEADFNCLFCYCPLYSADCGGNYQMTGDGVKDCSRCTFPHERGNYAAVLERLARLSRTDL